MKRLLFLLLPTWCFGQKHPTSYAEANPGVLNVFIDVSSDTAHLESLIGKFDKNEILRLTAFLKNSTTLKFQDHIEDTTGKFNDFVENPLFKLLNRKVDPCRIVASDTCYAIFNSQLENEVIRPLILWAKKHYDICQMQETIWGFDEAKQKLRLLNKKGR